MSTLAAVLRATKAAIVATATANIPTPGDLTLVNLVSP